MENTEVSLRDLPAGGAERAPAFDLDDVHTLDTLIKNGLCSNDNEAKRAHIAVLDKQEEHIITDDKQTKEALSDQIKSLSKQAAKFCMMCAVNDICYDYSMKAVRLDYGVFSAQSGSIRKIVAKENDLPQARFTRIRGNNNPNQGLAEAV